MAEIRRQAIEQPRPGGPPKGRLTRIFFGHDRPSPRARDLFDVRAPALDWLFVGLVAVWVYINVVEYSAYGQFLFQAGTLQRRMGPVFPVTYACAVALVLYGLLLFRLRYRLDYVRTVTYSVGIGLAATSLFEIIWQNIGSSAGVGNQDLWGQILNLSAIALGFSSIRYWSSVRPVLYFVIIYLTLWIVWLGIGYPQWYNVDPTKSLLAFGFNIALKIASFVLMGLLVSYAPKGSGELRLRAPVPATGGGTT